jgi:peroxiredoxin Q/BCP
MLKIGDTLPFFAVPNQDEVIISSDNLKGRWAVLYFYPKDNTPGCTQESCDFRDSIDSLKKLGCTVLGVSKDSSKSHISFISKYALSFDLLSDVDGKVCESFGVWVEKSMYGKKYFGIERSTFLISPNGNVAHIWRKVSVKDHVASVIKVLQAELQKY